MLEIGAGVDIGGGGVDTGGGGAETGGGGGVGGVTAVGVGVGGPLLSVITGGPESSEAVCNAGAPDKAGLLLKTLGAGTRTGAACGCTVGVGVGVA
ncbi:MAG TPA: hypothetical protein VIW64_09135 [Pyrinomonadaceae bacterium]